MTRAGDLLVVADDLSGAAETAAAVKAETGWRHVPVRLLREDGAPLRSDPLLPLVIDTNTRYAAEAGLGARLAPVLEAVAGRAIVVKKVDSLLRGNLAAEIRLLVDAGRSVLVCPALPALRRVVREGRVYVEDVPLQDTATWRFEGRPAPKSISEALGGLPATDVPLSAVRGAGASLARVLGESRAGNVLVCDAETQDDLIRLAEAALRSSDLPPVLVGSSAMAAAVGHVLGDGTAPAPDAVDAAHRVAFVVGTAEPSAHRQVAQLEALGHPVLRLAASALLSGRELAPLRADLERAWASPVSVIAVDPAERVAREDRPALVAALARLVAAAMPAARGATFVVTGGETARAVLDALDVGTVRIDAVLDGNAALGVTEWGVRVATRPGSFGGEDGLLRILAALTAGAPGAPDPDPTAVHPPAERPQP